MLDLSLDLSKYTIDNQEKPMQYESTASIEQLKGINFLFNPHRSLPDRITKPRYNQFVENSGFTNDTQILCNEFANLFLYNEQTSDRKTILSSPITKAWVDCCVLAGSLTENSHKSFNDRIYEALRRLESFVEQTESGLQSQKILSELFPFIKSSRTKTIKKQILEALSLIDMWDRNIVTLRDSYFNLKVGNLIGTYNLYRYAFPLRFIYLEGKTDYQQTISKQLIEQFGGTKEDIQNKIPFVNQIFSDCGLEDEEIEQLFKEYVSKLEYKDKRTKKANLFNL